MRAIVCVDEKWGIGKKNGLLFSIPEDMKYFREKTLGKTVCMGYNTLLSFPNSKPLKNRKNVVLCPDGIEIDGAICVHDLPALFSELKKEKGDIFVIGGAMFYKTMLPYCDEVLVTKVAADGEAEVFYENLDKRPDFVCTEEGEEFEASGYRIKFTVYKNKSPLSF
ncbi:MAG: dihydrofolate reductase [Clostridia bacterium]|nr:dihydrofolate reductase [Clostridia bacterium]